MTLSLEQIDEIVNKVKDDLLNHYRERISDIVLFGSYAKECANEESDIDILVLLANETANFSHMEFGWSIYDKYFREVGKQIHLVFEKKEFYHMGCEEFYRDVPQYGKTVYQVSA